jgi:hypothetical protein
MKVYRVTRRRNRPIYGAYSPTGTQTKVVTKRSLSAMLKAEGGTWTIIKVEEAMVCPFKDVTEAFLND